MDLLNFLERTSPACCRLPRLKQDLNDGNKENVEDQSDPTYLRVMVVDAIQRTPRVFVTLFSIEINGVEAPGILRPAVSLPASFVPKQPLRMLH